MAKCKGSGRVGQIEALLCEVCRKPIQTKGFFWRKKTCSPKCKLIRWALIEANKVIKK